MRTSYLNFVQKVLKICFALFKRPTAAHTVRNHPGGRLGPLEVIFDLFEKIDFQFFSGFFSIFPRFFSPSEHL